MAVDDPVLVANIDSDILVHLHQFGRDVGNQFIAGPPCLHYGGFHGIAVGVSDENTVWVVLQNDMFFWLPLPNKGGAVPYIDSSHAIAPFLVSPHVPPKRAL